MWSAGSPSPSPRPRRAGDCLTARTGGLPSDDVKGSTGRAGQRQACRAWGMAWRDIAFRPHMLCRDAFVSHNIVMPQPET
eukprot:1438444-Pleurochrysis_carterae.AAC.1